MMESSRLNAVSEAAPAGASDPDAVFDFDAARRLPKRIRFGSSTWTYPGWKGIIYRDHYSSERDFKARSLGEYSRCPLFRSVGIDHTFYRPATRKLFETYAKLVPADFVWLSKVWERITIAEYPRHARYGKNAGRINPDFLNAELFSAEILNACRDAAVRTHCGPFVFQFAPLAPDTLQRIDFIARLRDFLAALPHDFRYAIEIRTPELLRREYFDILNRYDNVTHCFNHWHMMPPLHYQMRCAAEAGGLRSQFLVARILTPLGVSYENAVKLFQPYDRVKRANPEMRKDVVRFVRRALERDAETFIIVNNRAEGHSPATIDALTRTIVTELL